MVVDAAITYFILIILTLIASGIIKIGLMIGDKILERKGCNITAIEFIGKKFF